MRSVIQKGCSVIFVMIFVLVGVGMVGISVKEFIDYRQLREDGMVVRGRMIDRYISTSEDSTSYYLVYEFAAANDRIYRDKQSVDRDLYDDFERGGSIQIEYDADNPTLSKVAGTNSVWTPLVLFCFGMGWTVFSLIFLGYQSYTKRIPRII
jgi:hypothetical protein